MCLKLAIKTHQHYLLVFLFLTLNTLSFEYVMPCRVASLSEHYITFFIFLDNCFIKKKCFLKRCYIVLQWNHFLQLSDFKTIALTVLRVNRKLSPLKNELARINITVRSRITCLTTQLTCDTDYMFIYSIKKTIGRYVAMKTSSILIKVLVILFSMEDSSLVWLILEFIVVDDALLPFLWKLTWTELSSTEVRLLNFVIEASLTVSFLQFRWSLISTDSSLLGMPVLILFSAPLFLIDFLWKLTINKIRDINAIDIAIPP